MKQIGLWKTAAKGMVTGAAMLVPGVSGGTTAIILGIYDKLVKAVSGFFKDVKGSVGVLLPFTLGGVIGVCLFSRLMLIAVETFPFPMMYFFLGAVAAGIPYLYRKTKSSKLDGSSILYMLAGVVLVMLTNLLPENLLRFDGGLTFGRQLLLAAAGIGIAVALVLPGISASYMLLMLGIYDTVLEAVGNLDLAYLIPLGLGGLAGIILTTGLLGKAMEKYPKGTFFLIIGFVLASLGGIFPGLPAGIDWVLCPIMLAAGFFLIRWVSKYND